MLGVMLNRGGPRGSARVAGRRGTVRIRLLGFIGFTCVYRLHRGRFEFSGRGCIGGRCGSDYWWAGLRVPGWWLFVGAVWMWIMSVRPIRKNRIIV